MVFDHLYYNEPSQELICCLHMFLINLFKEKQEEENFLEICLSDG